MSSLEQQQKRPSLHLVTETAIGAELAMPSSTSSPATTPLGSAGGATGFLPDMPQWKKDLIQRRKTNVARTNNAALCSPTAAAAAADVGGCPVALTEPSGESEHFNPGSLGRTGLRMVRGADRASRASDLLSRIIEENCDSCLIDNYRLNYRMCRIGNRNQLLC